MTGSERFVAVMETRIALEKYETNLRKSGIWLEALLKQSPTFRTFTIRALQAEAFNGKRGWLHQAIVEDAIDEWLDSKCVQERRN